MVLKKVVVFGSFVVDLMGRCARLPAPGETVKGGMFKIGPGGKGSNQAVAAAKAGADVTVITKLGRDVFADIALQSFKNAGVNSDHVLFDDEKGTGGALIIVDENTGQNAIAVLPSACENIKPHEVAAVAGVIEAADILLTQLETNLDALYSVIDIAKNAGLHIILNPAPAAQIPHSVYSGLFCVTPNETEAELITGVKYTGEASAREAAQWFINKGAKYAIITLGGSGAYVLSGAKGELIKAERVDVVDTTGAGDAFSGGLAAAIAQGKDIFDAARFATVVAALSVTKIGTAPAMPSIEEINEFNKTKLKKQLIKER